tara:strand:- start:182 stop:667 length:486 start_codon:yes stop_codon:yes gene_type:complete
MATKAINKNGVITVHNGVPQTLYGSSGTYLNAPAMSNTALREAGLYDVVYPEGYNSAIHDLSEIFWDSANTVFTYTKSDKTWSESLADMKTNKIANLKANANSKLAETDWYIIRKNDDGTAVPADITTARAAVRTAVGTKETEINALTEKSAVVLYDINLN